MALARQNVHAARRRMPQSPTVCARAQHGAIPLRTRHALRQCRSSRRPNHVANQGRLDELLVYLASPCLTLMQPLHAKLGRDVEKDNKIEQRDHWATHSSSGHVTLLCIRRCRLPPEVVVCVVMRDSKR